MDEWAIQVVGGRETIDRLKGALGPHDRVRFDDDASFLVRHEWQQASGWEEVDAHGRAFIKQMNGLMRIRGGGDPLRFGGVVLLKDGGAREFYESGTVVAKLVASAVEQIIGADGNPVPPRPILLLAGYR